MKMRAGRLVLGCVFVFVASIAPRVASAQSQPILDVDQAVLAPGESARVSVIGAPGHVVALLASSAGDGVDVGPLRLSLGPDWYIVAIGQLDASGRGAMSFAPTFTSTTVPKMHLQAAMTPRPDFSDLAPVVLSPGKVLRNAAMLFQSLGAVGPAGPAGAPGAQGPTGPQGSPGISGYERIAIPGLIAAGTTYTNVFTCPSGKRVLSGAIELTNGTFGQQANFRIHQSFPATDSAWSFELSNFHAGGGIDLSFNVWLTCVTTP